MMRSLRHPILLKECSWVLAAWLLGCQAAPVLPKDPVAQARQRLVESPHDPEVYLSLVHLSVGRQDYLRAAQYLSLAERSQLTAAQSETAFRLALTIYVRSQNYGEAVRRCQERLQQQESLPLRRLLAALHEVHGDAREAERQHLVMLELYPTTTEQIVEAARFYERSSLPDKSARAVELYRRYLAAAPDGAESAQVRAALLTNKYREQSQ